jgi:hypothetical protein
MLPAAQQISRIWLNWQRYITQDAGFPRPNPQGEVNAAVVKDLSGQGNHNMMLQRGEIK